MKVKILGIEFDIVMVLNSSGLSDSKAIAEVNYNTKTILMCSEYDDGALVGEDTLKRNLSHELAHAFLRFSGQEHLNNEKTVELMSQFYMACNFAMKSELIEEILKRQKLVIGGGSK